ncbi:cytochrome P450 [Penicillium canescens]|nr:cytochrome P450 [Penicillium canescens]
MDYLRAHNQVSFVVAICFALAAVIVYASATVVFNLFFHKLSNYPGPFLARSSLIWRMYHSQRGRFHIAIDDQHRKYGPVVRVSPNELSFASVESWKAIYGHRGLGAPTPIKSEFYDIYGAGFESLCIGSERNPHKHGKMRKMLSAAFATKSLVEQEHIISDAVDNFITRIGANEGQAKGLNMTKWFEMVSFDVLGEMAFGQSFDSVKAVDNLRRLPLVVTLTRLVFPSTMAVQNKNSQYSRQQVTKRLAKKVNRKDFLSTIVEHYEEGTVTKEEMTAHVSTLTIAGGETVSTFLAATTYYLLQNPDCYKRLQSEIVNRFTSYGEINATAARQLPYMQAVISEGLRIYPPGSQGFPRLSPGMQVGDYYVPAGAEIYTSAWSVTHSEKYFTDPMSFKPERWLDPASSDVKEASQPFSLGPRGCLGQNFAYMEINLILTKTFWKYDLELANPNLDWEGQSLLHVMWWKPELLIRFKERKTS